ncbi:hypothetical protein Q8A67_017787 [Cirrhinus molitorella]|uniref:Uncharacterized protein n=1 Tax=Cirrhinus molitorella TaxID=172907 RepID=A0AA88PKB1_9TELE|nr:hypothetical protein Q8A67_017787 [Cirrhinus molitorella]
MKILCETAFRLNPGIQEPSTECRSVSVSPVAFAPSVPRTRGHLLLCSRIDMHASPGSRTPSPNSIPCYLGPLCCLVLQDRGGPSTPSTNRAGPQCRGSVGWLISLPFSPERPVPHSSVSNLQPLLLLVQQHSFSGTLEMKHAKSIPRTDIHKHFTAEV